MSPAPVPPRFLSPPPQLTPPPHIFVFADCEYYRFKIQFLVGISGPERMAWSTVYLKEYSTGTHSWKILFRAEPKRAILDTVADMNHGKGGCKCTSISGTTHMAPYPNACKHGVRLVFLPFPLFFYERVTRLKVRSQPYDTVLHISVSSVMLVQPRREWGEE